MLWVKKHAHLSRTIAKICMVLYFLASTVYFNVKENSSGSQKYDVLSDLFLAISSNLTVFQEGTRFQ